MSWGPSHGFLIDTAVYSKAAIFKTAYWYTDRFYLFLDRDAEAALRVEIRPKALEPKPDLVRSCREFCNALIDQEVRQHVLAETGEVRDVLLRKAFGEGKQHLDPTKLASDESRRPSKDQIDQDDPIKIARPTGSA